MPWYRTHIRNKKTGEFRYPFGLNGIESRNIPQNPPLIDLETEELVTEDISKEIELRQVLESRIKEYPTITEWIEAEYDVRVRGDDSKRKILDDRVAITKLKHPKPLDTPNSSWEKLKKYSNSLFYKD